MKGLAAAALESLAAADAAGCEPWLRAEIAGVLEDADGSLVERLVQGSESTRHGARRRWRRQPRCCASSASSRGSVVRLPRCSLGSPLPHVPELHDEHDRDPLHDAVGTRA